MGFELQPLRQQELPWARFNSPRSSGAMGAWRAERAAGKGFTCFDDKLQCTCKGSFVHMLYIVMCSKHLASTSLWLAHGYWMLSQTQQHSGLSHYQAPDIVYEVRAGLGVQTKGLNPALLLISCVASGKLLSLSALLFPHP